MDYPIEGVYLSYCVLKNIKTVESNVPSGKTGPEHLTGQMAQLDIFPAFYKGERRRFLQQGKYC